MYGYDNGYENLLHLLLQKPVSQVHKKVVEIPLDKYSFVRNRQNLLFIFLLFIINMFFSNKYF